MSTRGSLPIGERINPAVHGAAGVQGAAASPVEPEVPLIRHCWVSDRHGRWPGLLLEWRRREDGWHGRVVRPVHEDDGWQVVEEWLPAALLAPAAA